MATCSLTIEMRIDANVQRLVRNTAAALDRAELIDPMHALMDMIGSRQLFSIESEGKTKMQIQLKPYAELALQEAIAISQNKTLDSALKSRKILSMFAMAGFAERIA